MGGSHDVTDVLSASDSEEPPTDQYTGVARKAAQVGDFKHWARDNACTHVASLMSVEWHHPLLLVTISTFRHAARNVTARKAADNPVAIRLGLWFGSSHDVFEVVYEKNRSF